MLALFAPSASGLVVGGGLPHTSVRTSSPAMVTAQAEAAAKAAWLAKQDSGSRTSTMRGKVVPTGSTTGSVVSSGEPTCGWATENYGSGVVGDNWGTRRSATPYQQAHPGVTPEMSCGWATDNFAAGSKAQHIAEQFGAAPAAQQSMYQQAHPGVTPEMSCGWATDNFAAGSKAQHIAKQFGAAPAAQQSMYQQAHPGVTPEMSCGWATDNFSEGSKAQHVGAHYETPRDDHDWLYRGYGNGM